MGLADQIVRDAPEGTFLRTSGVSSVNRLALSALGVGNSMTIAAWVRATTLPAEGVTVDVARLSPTSTTKNQIALSLVTSGGQSFWQWEVSDSTGATTNVQTGTTPVVAEDWYFILGCKNDQFTMRFFVNGLEDVALINAGIAATNNNNRKIYIGRDGRAINGPFDGDIGYVALWDIAISEESVKATYNGGWRDLDLRVNHACYGEASNLKQWWRLGQGAIDGAIAVGDEFVSNWVPSGLTLPDQIGVTQSEIMTPGLGPSGTSAGFGDGDFISTTPALPIAAAGQLSISFWILPTNVTTRTQTILFIGPDGPSTANAIHLSISADLAGDPFRVDFKSSTGTSLKRNNYDGMLIQDEWQHVLVTLDDTTFEKITVYHNGAEVEGVTEAGSGGSNLDSSRFIDIGGSTRGVGTTPYFTGLLGHVSIWDSILNSDEAQILYGQGFCIDTRYNDGQYVSGEPLKHYYKLGEDRFTTGRDFIDTRTGANVLPLIVTTGSVATRGNTPPGELVTPEFPVGLFSSVNLDGASECFLNATENLLSIGNSWTISFWAKQNAFPLATEDILDLKPNTGTTNRILVQQTSTGQLVVSLNNSGGGILFVAEYDFVFVDNEWNHIVITWTGGTEPDVYINSSFTVADTVISQISGSMSDTVRTVRYGCGAAAGANFSGRVGHLAMWSTNLIRNQIKEIFLGNHSIDLTVNTGDYTQSGNLQHYYRMGFADTGTTDEGSGVPSIDLSDTVGIDATNIRVDAPPNPFLPWESSVLMDGSTNYLFGAGDSSLGFGDAWTISFWARTANPGGVILDVGPSGSGDSSILIGTNGDGSISFSASKTGGAGVLYADSYSDFFDEDEWVHVVAQWDGTEIRLYKNGVVQVGTGPTDNRPGAMADDAREISYGALSTGASFWDGHLGHLTFWDIALNPTNIAALYCGGGSEMDHRFDDGDYSVASDLVHYYRPGWVDGSDETGTKDENLDNVSRDNLDTSVIDDTDIADGEAPDETCPFVQQMKSLEFDDSNNLDSDTPSAVGITGTFSIAIWSKYLADSNDGVDSLFAIKPTPLLNTNAIEITTVSTSVASIRIFITDNDGNNRQRGDFAGIIDGGSVGANWDHYVLTWNGAVSGLKMHYNGVDQGVPVNYTANSDDTGIVDDPTRVIYIGARSNFDEWPGRVYSVAIFDQVISEDEAAALYNGGNARDFNVEADSGAYVSSDALIHYYRPGLDDVPANFGKDYAGTIDLDEQSLVVGDLSSDIPV